jgi:4-amino-4-deoxy-L-arabinose transferase-like glycosyltransferase
MIFGAQRLRWPALADAIQRRPGVFAWLLCVLWMLPGLFGRDPWKPDEAYVVGLVLDLWRTGDWTVPTLAGEPFLRHPPLYLGLAAWAGRAFDGLFALHEAFRLVNLLFVGGAFVAVALAGATLVGPGRGWLAALLLAGCVGLLQPGHQLVPDNALLFATALGCLGLARIGAARPAWQAALAIAAGIAIAGAGKGLLGAAALALAPLVVLALRPSTDAARAIVPGVVAGIAGAAVWPALLHARSADLFAQWLALHEWSRHFPSDDPAGGVTRWWYYARVLPWFTWPVWPLAAWTLWTGRAQWRTPPLLVPSVVGIVWLALLTWSQDKRELHALPLLVPAVLLAMPGLPQLRRGAANLFFWFAIAFFLFLLAVAWVYGSAAEFGVPERLARHLRRLEPGHVPTLHPLALGIAIALTAGWFVAMFNVRRTPERAVVVWAIGVVAFWGVSMTLFVGYVDHAKTYRPVAASLVAAVPAGECVTSRGLGDSQRALFDYFGAIRTRRVEHGARLDACPLLLVEGTTRTGFASTPWLLIWEGHRAGDKRERFRLYRNALPDATVGAETP